MKTESSCENGLQIPFYFGELLLRKLDFGNTQAQNHPSTYLNF